MSNDPSVLESEIEQARERLASTLDQLIYRANPKTIIGREVTSVKSRFVDLDTGEPRTDNIVKAGAAVLGVVVLFAMIRKIVR